MVCGFDWFVLYRFLGLVVWFGFVVWRLVCRYSWFVMIVVWRLLLVVMILVWLVFDCVGYAFARLFGWLLFSGCLLRLRLVASVLWVVC